MSLIRRRFSWCSALASFSVALFVFCLSALSVAQTGATAPLASRLTQPIDDGQLVTLQGTVHRLATKANDRGAADAGLALDRVQVMLKRSPAQETALRQLLQEIHQPGAANYHKWLTPEQFGEQFGPSDADIATLSNWLSSHGFSVTKVNPGKQTLEISGSAGQFQKTFHASIHKYQVNGQTHYANSSDPLIPAALAPVFGGFASLNNFPMRSYAKVLGHAAYTPSLHKVVPEWTVGNPSDGYDFLLAPGDFAVQYDLNPLYNAGTTGAGQTIGIINESNISIPLVNQYRTLFGLPSNPPNVIIDGNDPGIDGANNPDGPNGASGEAYLDVEVAGAVAPAATVDLIIAGDTALENGLSLAAEHAVYGNVAPVVSISFGNCEAAQGAGGNSFWNTLWEQAAAQGQTVMVSTGDAGSAGCDDDNVQEFAVYGQEVNGIASTPWNVAVGGTDFYYTTYGQTMVSGHSESLSQAQVAELEQYWGKFVGTSSSPSNASNTTPTVTLLQKVPEQPWNDSQFGFNFANQYALGEGSTIAGGSGGASNCATGMYGSNTDPCGGYPKPAWQTGTGVPVDGVRDLPDVSLFAANGANFTYYPICAVDGDCQPVTSGEVQITGVGGTSAASPAFAGIMALVNQKYGPQGQANFVLYPLATQYPASFNDVTIGSNSVPCNLEPLSYYGMVYSPDDCLSNGTTYTATDPIYGTSTEGQISNLLTSAPDYNAGAGYDLASGLGTIDATNLIANWGNVKFTSSSVTLGSSQTTFPHGTSVTISGTVAPGAATGLVSLETTSSVPLNAAQATFPVGANGAYSGKVNFLPGGTYDIYGTYSGDSTDAPSTSSKTSITVTPENSTTSLSLLNSVGNQVLTNLTIPYGSQLLLEAQPVGSASGTNSTVPTGSVTYLNGTSTIGTATLSATGAAELNYAPVPSSTPYSVTASYSGDASYNASKSSATTFTVGKNTPSILLASGTESIGTLNLVSGSTSLTVGIENSANSFGQGATGAAFVTPALAPTGVVTMTGLPGGTITFPALSSVVDPNTLFVEGTATLQLPAETPGTYSIFVNYPGDANYAATAGEATLSIVAPTGIATTTTATATPATSYSTAPSVSFTVTGTTAGGPPTGTVTFLTSGNIIGSVTLPTGGTGASVSGTVSLNGYLVTGSNELIVQYSGSSVYEPSSATAFTQNGGTPSPAITLTNSSAITLAAGGASGTSTVTVTPSGGFTGAVGLTCAVTGTGTSLPTCAILSPVTISGTTAATSLLTVTSTSSTMAGSYTVTVTGTGTGVTAATIAVAVTVQAPPPAIALSNSGPIALAAGGTPGTSTITVTPSGGFTGAVGLACAVTGTGASLPTCAILSPVTISGTTVATSTLTVTSTSSTSLGSYTVTVTGTGTGVTAATTAIPVTVSEATVVLSNSGPITIASAGSPGTSTVSLTPGGGFTGPVALTCGVAATSTDTPTCAITSPVTISGTAAGTATLTVNTVAASAALAFPPMSTKTVGGGIAAAALLFFIVPIKRRRISKLLGLLVLVAVAGFSTGCGSEGSSTGGNSNPGTPAGTYTVTVSGTATGVTIAPITVSVTVQ